jgi:hypothetical protein
MSCCGQRRRALISGPLPVVASAASVTAAHATTAARGLVVGGVTLRYRGLGAFTMRSPRTYRLYACGASGATLQVETGDVDALLRTRLFTRA